MENTILIFSHQGPRPNFITRKQQNYKALTAHHDHRVFRSETLPKDATAPG